MMKGHVLKWVPRAAAILLGIQGLWWVWIYTMTTYRSHLRAPMLIIAAAALAYAVFLFLRNRWVVLSSMAFALTGAGVLIWFQATESFDNHFLVATTLILLCYGLGLAWALRSSTHGDAI